MESETKEKSTLVNYAVLVRAERDDIEELKQHIVYLCKQNDMKLIFEKKSKRSLRIIVVSKEEVQRLKREKQDRKA